MSARVLLLMPTTTYKAQDFMDAADRLGADVVVGTNRRQSLQDAAPGTTMTLDFERAERAVPQIVEAHARDPFAAVVGTDDETTVLAATAGAALGLRHNTAEAARAARDKLGTRRRMRSSGMRCPDFLRVPIDDPPGEVAAAVRFPCVIKPLRMSASRGVLRADHPDEFVRAFARVAAIVRDSREDGPSTDALLVEDYVPGTEVAVEALLDAGSLRVLAVFDKPDPLEGPTFEETVFLTPSGLSAAVLSEVEREVARGCRALGLTEGPVHAELRIAEDGPWLLEVAPRTIGGICSRTLRFGTGASLEEVILRHALGRETVGLAREGRAAGVMMIPIPRAGILRGVAGLESARAVQLVEDVTVSIHRGSELVPLPEGHQYLGFIFARGEHPREVDHALRAAHARLSFTVEPPD